MSIAVLKKKAAAKYSKNISVGKDGFSINGTIRLKGVVGPTNLAVSVTRTRFKGTQPVGAGGKNGSSYPIIIANSGHCHAEGGFVASDSYPSKVKLSTKNTKGAIINKNKWMHRGYPNYWVTPINNGYNIVNSAGQYISKKQALNYCNSCDKTGKDPFDSDAGTKDTGCCKKGYHIGGRLVADTSYTKHVKPNNTYFDRLQKLKYPLLNPSGLKKPFPFRLIHDGCDTNYTTIEQAQAAGAL